MAIKNFFLNLRTKNALNNQSVVRKSTAPTQTSRYGILFTSAGDDKAMIIREFSKQLIGEGKNVRILEFIPKYKKNTPLSGFPYFTNKDVTLLGQINNADEESFVKSDFDYLFLADLELHPVMINVLARSHAKCRVGLHAEGRTPFLDLMIQMPGKIEDLLSEMLIYIKKLS